MARPKTPPPDVPGKTEEREKSKRISALVALAPFMWPYRGLMFAALAALVATAFISLTLPLAVRRVVDNFDTWIHTSSISISRRPWVSRCCWRSEQAFAMRLSPDLASGSWPISARQSSTE